MPWTRLLSRCCTPTAATLLLALGCWLLPVSGWSYTLKATELSQIRSQYFTPSRPESQVREVTWNSQTYYVIRAATLNIFDQDSHSRIQQRLTLLGKVALLSFLKQKSSSVTRANLRYYQTGLIWKEGDYSYGLFYIQKSDVTPLGQERVQPRPPSPPMPQVAAPYAVPQTPLGESSPESTPSTSSSTSESEPLDPDTLRTTLDTEIARLEQHLKQQPKDLSTWENLQALYRQTGDVDNLNRVLDIILKLKGTVSDTP